MASGYTAEVQSGEISEFKDFAMICARAFGALIEMRDDPADAKIPDAFPVPKPSDNWAIAERKALRKLQRMSLATAKLEAEKAYKKELASWEIRIAEQNLQRQRYEAMLSKVRQYRVPSKDHERFKQFMIEQLESSIEFDCGDWNKPKKLTARKWLSQQIRYAKRLIKSYEETHREAVSGAKSRNKWLRQLRESLA